MTEIEMTFESGQGAEAAEVAAAEAAELTEAVEAAEVAAAEAERARAGTGGPMTHCNLMMNRALLARLDRLRACTGESRSRVVEMVLTETTLDVAEKVYGPHIREFGRLAEAAGVDWIVYAQAYATAFARQTYPPTVTVLGNRIKGADFRKTLAAVLKAGAGR